MIEYFVEYPPAPYFNEVLVNCPQAATVYCRLWNKRDKENWFRIPKKLLSREFLLPSDTVNRHFMALCRRGFILDIKENNTTIDVELLGWDDEE